MIIRGFNFLISILLSYWEKIIGKRNL